MESNGISRLFLASGFTIIVIEETSSLLYSSSVCGCLFFFINSIDNNIIGTNSLRKFFTNFYPKSDTRIEI